MVAPLNRRVAAVQSLVDAYAGKPLTWGRRDCGRGAAWILRKLGHNAKLSRFGEYTNEIGARRAMKRAGFTDLGDVLDDLNLPRIPLAWALPADLVGLPGDGDWTALGVWVGNGRLLAIAPDGVWRVGELHDLTLASCWQVNPLEKATS